MPELTKEVASKESLKSKVNSLEHVLQDVCVNLRHVGPNWFYLCKLEGLIEVGNGLSIKTPSLAPFLDGGVIEFAA